MLAVVFTRTAVIVPSSSIAISPVVWWARACASVW